MQELHIAGLVVHAAPARRTAVEEAVRRLDGACVHASTAQGKLVVTLEAPSSDDMTAAIAMIQRTPGVLSAALVYQGADTLDAMNERMTDAQA